MSNELHALAWEFTVSGLDTAARADKRWVEEVLWYLTAAQQCEASANLVEDAAFAFAEQQEPIVAAQKSADAAAATAASAAQAAAAVANAMAMVATKAAAASAAAAAAAAAAQRALTVSAAFSAFNSTNLTATSVSPAGSWTRFTVQLRNASGGAVTTLYDRLLSVACNGDPAAPLDPASGRRSTFCTVEPIIQAIGNGTYTVAFMVGTIWGAHQGAFPPTSSSTFGVSAALPGSYFQGSNSLSVIYNGTHLPGSPFNMSLKPATEVDTGMSAVNMYSQAWGVAGVGADVNNVASFYQINDAYGNWIRGPNITSRIQATLRCISGNCAAGATVPMSVSWWSTNWSVKIFGIVSQAGQYQLSATWRRTDGLLVPLRIVSSFGVVDFSAPYEVRPRAPDHSTSSFTLSITSPIPAVKNVATQILLQTRDMFGNPTGLCDYDAGNPSSMTDPDLGQVQVSVSVRTHNWGFVAPMASTTPASPGAIAIYVTWVTTGTVAVNVQVCGVALPAVILIIGGATALASHSTLYGVNSVPAGLPLNVTFRAVDITSEAAPANMSLLAVSVAAIGGGASAASAAVTMLTHSLTEVAVSVRGLLAVGQYRLAATYGGIKVPVEGGGLFSVLPNATVSLLHSVVYGTGAGVLPSAADNSSGTIVAGQMATIHVLARDAFGNTITGPFQLNTGFASRCVSLGAVVGSMGDTTISYVLNAIGTYQLSVLASSKQVMYQGVVTVLAAQVSPKASNVTIQPATTAGGTTNFTAVVVDVFGNRVTSLAPAEVFVQVYACGATPLWAGAAQLVGLLYNPVLGKYRGSLVITTPGCYTARAYVHQDQLGAAAVSWTVVAAPLNLTMTALSGGNVTLDGEVQLVLVSRDTYGNAVAGAGVAAMVTRMQISPPCLSCSAHASSVTSGGQQGAPAITFTLASPGTYSCSVTLASGNQSVTLVRSGIVVVSSTRAMAVPPSALLTLPLAPPTSINASSSTPSDEPSAGISASPAPITTSTTLTNSKQFAVSIGSLEAISLLIMAMLVWWGWYQRQPDSSHKVGVNAGGSGGGSGGGSTRGNTRKGSENPRRSLTLVMDCLPSPAEASKEAAIYASPVKPHAGAAHTPAPRSPPALGQPVKLYNGRPGTAQADAMHSNPLAIEQDTRHRLALVSIRGQSVAVQGVSTD